MKSSRLYKCIFLCDVYIMHEDNFDKYVEEGTKRKRESER